MKLSGRKKVLTLVLSCFIIYFFGSIITSLFQIEIPGFSNVNLISEVFPAKESSDKISLKPPIELPQNSTGDNNQDFELYNSPKLITDFYKDSVALPGFAEKLEQLQKGEKIKIRIAYFGDSMIEGDLLTQNLRKLLQEKFGGSGVGYLPLASEISGFRTTANVSSENFRNENFTDKGAKNMYFSGYSFYGNGSGNYTDRTITDASVPLEKYILYKEPQTVIYNGKKVILKGLNIFNKEILSSDVASKFSLKGNNTNSKIFGVGFESASGIILDNYSFRGITGTELKKLSEEFLGTISKENSYDLIVFQYGVNLLFRPKDTDYSVYERSFTPVLQNFKKAFPNSDFLIVSSADRAFRYNGEYKSAIGIHNLIQLQAQLALSNKMAFYNQFESMGGENSIVKWAEQSPSLAGKDYVHPNAKGGEILANYLFQAMLHDYELFLKKKQVKDE